MTVMSATVSLDKVESSNPNLTAAHAGASTRKTGHLQPSASNAADAEGGLFCVFQTRFPHEFECTLSTGKSGETPALRRKTTISTSLRNALYSPGPYRAREHGDFEVRPYEAGTHRRGELNGIHMLNPAYQNPDRRGRAGVTRGYTDDRG